MRLEITGPIKGGKNNYLVLRNGMHVPRPAWKMWRDEVVARLAEQGQKFECITVACDVTIDYRAGDMRRRDIPAIVDAIFHCLERAKILTDDFLVKDLTFRTRYDKNLSGATIDISPHENRWH